MEIKKIELYTTDPLTGEETLLLPPSEGNYTMMGSGKSIEDIIPSNEDKKYETISCGNSMNNIPSTVVDGVCKSAILKGNTLVNIIPTKSDSVVATTAGIVRVLNLTELVQPVPVGDRAILLFESTFPYDKHNGFVQLYIYENGENKWIGATNFSNMSNGKNFIIINNTFEYAIEKIDVCVNNSVVGDYALNNIMLIPYQEGMENWGIPYFEGMCSVKMPVLTTVGKNLCKYSGNWTNNGLTFTTTSNGVIVNGTASTHVDYYLTTRTGQINVETLDKLNNLPIGTTLYLSNSLGKNNYISYKVNGGENRFSNTVTIQDGMEFIGVFVRFQQGDICDNLNLTVQLETGTQKTPYEPYKSNILSTPNDLVLRGIGDVKDTLDCLTGEVVKRIEELTLQGSDGEGWYLTGITPVDTTLVRFDFNNPHIQNGKNHPLLCDKLPYIFIHGLSGGSTMIAQECISNHSENRTISIVIKKNRLIEPTVDGFKQWLQSNPITIQYELSTPTHKTVDLSIVNQDGAILENLHSFSNGHIQLSSSYESQSLLPTLDIKLPKSLSAQLEDSTNALATQHNTLLQLRDESIRKIIDTHYNTSKIIDEQGEEGNE